MLGVADDGLGGRRTAEGGRGAFAGALRDPAAAARPARGGRRIRLGRGAVGATRAQADKLLGKLRDAGALAEASERILPLAGISLGQAIIAAARGRSAARHVWTAEELLVLPAGADEETVRRTLWAFVAGLRGDARLRAYCQAVLRGKATTRGDRPSFELLAAAWERLAGSYPNATHVVGLTSGEIESAPAGEAGSLGAGLVHRLGTVVRETGGSISGGLHHRATIDAVPEPCRPWPAAQRICRGTALEPEHARLVARAEAVERHAAGDVGRHDLRRACAAQLSGAVGMDAILSFSSRQPAAMPDLEVYFPDESYLWVRARTPAGIGSRLPAEAVFCPFDDPERERSLSPGVTTSGLAAHTEPDWPSSRALCELIERDALMWHWVQRVTRERIDRAGVSPETQDLLRRLDGEGFEAELVNLTLETAPVILCVLEGHGGLFLVPPATSTRRRRRLRQRSRRVRRVDRDRRPSSPRADLALARPTARGPPPAVPRCGRPRGRRFSEPLRRVDRACGDRICPWADRSEAWKRSVSR